MSAHANHSTIDSKTVTSATSQVLAANRFRKTATFVNTGAVDCYLAVGTAAVSPKGICLKASGGSYEINSTNLSFGAVNAITASSTTTLAISEGV